MRTFPMRLPLAGLALLLSSGLAAADCSCACVRGRAIPVCSPPALVEPICQQVCLDRIEQSLGSMSLSGGGAGGGAAGASAPLDGGGGLSDADRAAAMKALIGR